MEHDEDFKAYALNDVTLLIKLHRYLKDNSSNYGLWKGEISTLAYQQWTRGFNGVKVNIKDLQVRIQELGDLRTKLLTMLPDLTMGTDSVSNAKGWNSPKLVDKWLRDTFDSNTLSHLTINDKSQLYRFDAEGRETIISLYPTDMVIKALIDFRKKDKLWGELKTMRKHLDKGILRYGYCMTATGRFTSSKPAIHNFSAKEIDTSTFILLEEQQLSETEVNIRYDLRSLLIQGDGVYKLDFATQENRMVASIMKPFIKTYKGFVKVRNLMEQRLVRLKTIMNYVKYSFVLIIVLLLIGLIYFFSTKIYGLVYWIITFFVKLFKKLYGLQTEEEEK